LAFLPSRDVICPLLADEVLTHLRLSQSPQAPTAQCRHVPGDRWFVDETYVKVAGRWVYLYRAIDQYGQVIDVLVSQKRDMVATRRFFTRALEHGPSPSEVTTDGAAAYPRVLEELVPAACHLTEQYTNNPSKPITVGSRPGCGRCVG
jgi:transposase-like protein